MSDRRGECCYSIPVIREIAEVGAGDGKSKNTTGETSLKEERVWIRHGDTTARFPGKAGKLDVSLIARKWKMDPVSLFIGPDALDVENGLSVYSISEIREIAAEVGAGDGKSKNTAFVLTTSESLKEERVWIRHGYAAARFRAKAGKLDVSLIASKWKLDPVSLFIGPDALDVENGLSVYSISEIREIAAEVGAGDGKSMKTAFVLTTAGSLFVPALDTIPQIDCTKEQVELILNACSPYQVTGNDSPSDVEAFLSDFDALRGKVSTSFLPASMKDFFVTRQSGRFSSCIGALLSGFGEQFVAQRPMSFQWIWDLLREVAPGPRKLNYISTNDKAEDWKFFIKSKRSDNIILGSGKLKSKLVEFEKAKKELTAKVVELPAAMYGKLKFVVCYVAAGPVIQFFMLRLRKVVSPTLSAVTERITDSARLVLYYIKLYFLLLGMDGSVSAGLPFELNTEMTHGHCRIKLTLDGAVKKIPDFGAYASEHGILYEDLTAAYTAAQSSDGYMIKSVMGPRQEVKEVEVDVVEATTSQRVGTSSSSAGSKRSGFTSSSGSSKKRRTGTTSVSMTVYEVSTYPLLSEKLPETEEDLRAMADGVLRGLQALHAAGLVHRDVRYANVLYDYAQEKYVLIDLESVGKDNQVPAFTYKGWTDRTLDKEKRYTMLSDLHQLGLLLQLPDIQDRSETCTKFIDQILSKVPGTTAESLLKHAWIVGNVAAERTHKICNGPR